MSIRDKILAAVDIPLHKVHIPEWDCDIHLRPWSLNEKMAFHKCVKEHPELPGFNMALVMSVCDELGKPVFKTTDIEALGEKNSVILERIGNEVFELNGLSDKEIDKKKAN